MRLLSEAAAAGWPLSATLAVALAGLSIRAGRRRNALNQALHELRRPLQTLALMAPESTPTPGQRLPGTLQLALSALAKIENELNGGDRQRRLGPVPCRALVEAAIGRWRSRASLAGGRIELRWRAGLPLLRGDRAELSQALDNLIVNAIEHGGPMITVDASRRNGRLRIAVADSGSESRPLSRRGSPGEVVGRLTGRKRHGHGLAVVRRVAAAHGGRFAIDQSERGSVAVLELPVSAERPSRAA
jgi:two-component system sensor histidine kinase HydH